MKESQGQSNEKVSHTDDSRPWLEVNHLMVQQGPFRLGPVTFSLGYAQCGVVIGPSGSGKSTLLEALCGLRPSSGTILLGGRPVEHLPPEARQMALVPQDYALFPHLSARSNILLVPRLRRLSDQALQERFHTLIRLLQLEPLLNKKPDQLSGGERQRVALARALVLSPTLLLLDEPFAALDPQIRPPVRRRLRQIFKELGTTVLLVSHDPMDAAALADMVYVLEKGQLLQWGPWDQVIRQPLSPYLTDFVGINRLTGIVVSQGDQRYLQVGTLLIPVHTTLPDGCSATLHFYPSHVTIHPTPAPHTIPVKVVERLDLGDRFQISAEVSDGVVVTLEGSGPPPVSIGQILFITITAQPQPDQ
ncbi:MAG: ABC transporter ATP-binding protein [Armatimonadetes bacterium]|nr:ABC transporter ATP-binding protein [Armatimonadota bacterium]MDW8122770.1 ABC transporter ATP-binding protein [Armatimonadota bacterium]